MSLPRYPAYKPSGVEWLGEVPEHWEVLPLKREFDVVGGSTPKSDIQEYWDGDIQWITPADLSRLQSFEITESIRAITAEGLNSCGTTMVPSGSVVVSTRAPIGSLGIAGIDLCTNQGCKALVPIDQISSRFTAYFLGIATEALNVRGRGATFLEISGDELGAFKVTLPPCQEQVQIATFLDHETAKIDALIAEQQRLIELLQEKRQAVISHAVTKGLNPNAPIKDSGVEWLGEVPEHWELSRVKVISSFTTSGPRGWSEQISEDGALFVQSGDLNDYLGVDFEDCKRVRVSGDAEALRTRLQPGDAVVCITGAKTGNAAVCHELPEDSYINQHLCLIRPRNNIEPGFLGLLLKSHCGQTHFALAQYGLKQGLSLENVRETPLVLPPMKEQVEIVSYVNKVRGFMRSLINESHHSVEILKERRSALISAAVTGQIDVRGLVEAEGGEQ